MTLGGTKRQADRERNDPSAHAERCRPDRREDGLRPRAASAPLILEYGDYECPYSRQACAIERVEQELRRGVRFAFRRFPLTEIHPHAMAAACAAEAAALHGRFWQMHELLFHRQNALADEDLRAYAKQIGLDVERFERECSARSGGSESLVTSRTEEASGVVHGTPTLFINGVLFEGSYDTLSLSEVSPCRGPGPEQATEPGATRTKEFKDAIRARSAQHSEQ